MPKLGSAQAKYKILVANLRSGSDPSRGPVGNPVKLRTGFEQQMLPEIARSGTDSPASTARTPGITTLQGLLEWTTATTPVGATATVVVADNDFTVPATLFLGPNTLTSGIDFLVGAVAQATGSATVVATPSTATLTIGGVPLTASAGARTPGANDYDGTLGTVALIAADIVAAINDGANGFAAIATAVDGGAGLVSLTAVPVGAAGNAVTLATTDVLDVTVSAATLANGVNAAASTATALASAIDDLPGFSAVAVGSTITVTGPFGLDGNTQDFLATYRGAIQNYTLTPTDGVMTGAEPFIGPPVLL
jgi:hypothetical protein